MHRHTNHPASGAATARVASLLTLLLALAGCGDATDPTMPRESGAAAAAPAAAPAEELSPEQIDLLRTVRRATSLYRSPLVAAEAGYEETDHCVPGMGYHWVKPSLVDPVFDPLAPEVMIYAPGPRGRLRLVAVEYVVIDAGQAPPTFAGQPFDVGGTPVPVPHWSLHVWLYEPNPDGVFAPFNPTISCP